MPKVIDASGVFQRTVFAAYVFALHGNHISFMNPERPVLEDRVTGSIPFFKYEANIRRNRGDDTRVAEVAEFRYGLWP